MKKPFNQNRPKASTKPSEAPAAMRVASAEARSSL